jgi:hypothetical protein
MRFQPGYLTSTPGALEALEDAKQSPMEFVQRHLNGDWGEVDKKDAAENELSVRLHFRILSAYQTNKGVRLWVITEADRSSTTILLPEEY